MNRPTSPVVCYGLLVSLMIAGAVGTADDRVDKNVKEVREVAADFYDSASQANYEKFKSTIFVREGEEELHKAVFNLVRRGYEFRKALIGRFGANALEAAKKLPSGRGIEILAPPEGREWVMSLEFEFPDADTAVAFNKYTNRDIVFVRRKDKWLVDLLGEYERPLYVKVKEIAQTLNELASAYEKGVAECKIENSAIPEVVDAVIAEFTK